MITALYHIMLVLMLLNLMISLLVKKADEVLENEDTEYKYTRIAIYSEYISWESTIPRWFRILRKKNFFDLYYKSRKSLFLLWHLET